MEKARGAGRWVWRVLAIGAMILPEAGGAQSWHRPPPVLLDDSPGFHGLFSANSGAGSRQIIESSWRSAPMDSAATRWGARGSWSGWSQLSSTSRLAVWAETRWAPEHLFGGGFGLWIRKTEAHHQLRPLLQFHFSVPAGPARLQATWQGTPETEVSTSLQQTDLQRITLSMTRTEGDWTGRIWMSTSGHGPSWSLQAWCQSSRKSAAPVAWSVGCGGPPWCMSLGVIWTSECGRKWPIQWAMNGKGDLEWTQGW